MVEVTVVLVKLLLENITLDMVEHSECVHEAREKEKKKRVKEKEVEVES